MPGIFLRAQPPSSEAQFQDTDAFSMDMKEGRGREANADVRVQVFGRIYRQQTALSDGNTLHLFSVF